MHLPPLTFLLRLACALGAVLLALGMFAGGASARASKSVLEVHVVGNGSVTGPNGINCTTTGDKLCDFDLPDVISLTITAQAATGWTFTGWDYDCTGTTPTCSLDFDQSYPYVKATFVQAAPQNIPLQVSVTGPGQVTGTGISCGNGATDCSKSYPSGTSVTLSAAPASGATFSGWGGACSGSTTTCTVTMNSAQSVSATFTGGTGTTYPLSVTATGSGAVTGGGINCGNGATTCSANIAAGSTVTLTATPASGATFSGWGGDCSGTSTTCVLSMTAGRSVSATFTGSGSTTQPLIVSVSGNGVVSGPGISCGNGSTDCSESYANGTSVTLSAAPASGATFSGWSGACSGTGTCVVTMSAARSVGATFITSSGGGATFQLAVSVTGRGLVSGPGITCGAGYTDCTETYATGAVVSLQAGPGHGSVFSGWGGACSGTGACTLTMTADRSVTAQFSGGGSSPTPLSGFRLTSLGRPLISFDGASWSVSVRFHTNRAGTAVTRTFRSGRLLSSFAFAPNAGNVLVGPFVLFTPGDYTISLALTDAFGVTRTLSWTTCLGGCGSFRPPAANTLVAFNQGASVARGVGGWLITVRFQVNRAVSAHLVMLRAGSGVSSFNFSPRGGSPVFVRLPVGSAGVYTILCTLRDAQGRVRTLRWDVRAS